MSFTELFLAYGTVFLTVAVAIGVVIGIAMLIALPFAYGKPESERVRGLRERFRERLVMPPFGPEPMAEPRTA